MFLQQKWRVRSTSSFSQPHAHLAPRLLEQEESFQMRSRAFRNLHTPYAERSVAPLNGKQLRPLVCFVPLFGPLSEQRRGIRCLLHREFSGAIHVSVDCSEFGRLAPVEPEHLPVLTPPRLPLSPYPLLTLSLPLFGLDPRVRTVLLTPFPLFSSQLAFFFLSFR